jgi:hypothetical protein
MSFSTFVYTAWIVIGVLALVLVVAALTLGLLHKFSVKFWRKVKLATALLGVFGLFFLLINFERIARDTFFEEAKHLSFLEFLDMKFFIAQSTAKACLTPSRREACDYMRNLDGVMSFIDMRDFNELPTIENWTFDSSLDDFVSDVNSRVDAINLFMPTKNRYYKILSTESRIIITLFGVLCIIIAMAGSVGDAAFQLADANAQERRSRNQADAANRDKGNSSP